MFCDDRSDMDRPNVAAIVWQNLFVWSSVICYYLSVLKQNLPWSVDFIVANSEQKQVGAKMVWYAFCEGGVLYFY